jgi:hypothetical protein
MGLTFFKIFGKLGESDKALVLSLLDTIEDPYNYDDLSNDDRQWLYDTFGVEGSWLPKRVMDFEVEMTDEEHELQPRLSTEPVHFGPRLKRRPPLLPIPIPPAAGGLKPPPTFQEKLDMEFSELSEDEKAHLWSLRDNIFDISADELQYLYDTFGFKKGIPKNEMGIAARIIRIKELNFVKDGKKPVLELRFRGDALREGVMEKRGLPEQVRRLEDEVATFFGLERGGKEEGKQEDKQEDKEQDEQTEGVKEPRGLAEEIWQEFENEVLLEHIGHE